MQCQYVEYHADMYPEFAPDPIVIHCKADATVNVVGYDIEGPCAPDDDGKIDLLLCEEHRGWIENNDEVVNVTATVLTEHYRQGYTQGHAEGELAPMATQTAFIIAYEGELPSGFEARYPLSGEWCDEAVDWNDDQVEQYRDGFTRGWTYALTDRANVIVGAEQDID